ncbi:hypothetical protein [Streptomyces sp. RKAG293]|uniref:hypothetical protein n=1 Tax=Streptomyces sp. RKAG293 TaxID=2893403 RepID=UPI002034A056|nr:hypothetical protein [Streptomyces sp. RKAG293]MCM2420227.1 hypothetical protein [Streptomyces sp. RKAG293]
MKLLAQHRDQQELERRIARDLWVEKGYVFTSPTGEPLHPTTDHHKWRELLEAERRRATETGDNGSPELDQVRASVCLGGRV